MFWGGFALFSAHRRRCSRWRRRRSATRCCGCVITATQPLGRFPPTPHRAYPAYPPTHRVVARYPCCDTPTHPLTHPLSPLLFSSQVDESNAVRMKLAAEVRARALISLYSPSFPRPPSPHVPRRRKYAPPSHAPSLSRRPVVFISGRRRVQQRESAHRPSGGRAAPRRHAPHAEAVHGAVRFEPVRSCVRLRVGVRFYHCDVAISDGGDWEVMRMHRR